MNKYVEKDAKRAHRRKGLAIFAAIVAVGSAGVWGYHELKPVAPLSADAQTSLIEVETEETNSCSLGISSPS